MIPDRKKKALPSGATRTNIDHVRYDLISPYGHERWAKRYALGAERHGERNWESGMPNEEIINHIKRHIT